MTPAAAPHPSQHSRGHASLRRSSQAKCAPCPRFSRSSLVARMQPSESTVCQWTMRLRETSASISVQGSQLLTAGWPTSNVTWGARPAHLPSRPRTCCRTPLMNWRAGRSCNSRARLSSREHPRSRLQSSPRPPRRPLPQLPPGRLRIPACEPPFSFWIRPFPAAPKRCGYGSGALPHPSHSLLRDHVRPWGLTV